jgi:hypothetical protein
MIRTQDGELLHTVQAGFKYKGKRQNTFSGDHIQKIVDTY